MISQKQEHRKWRTNKLFAVKCEHSTAKRRRNYGSMAAGEKKTFKKKENGRGNRGRNLIFRGLTTTRHCSSNRSWRISTSTTTFSFTNELHYKWSTQTRRGKFETSFLKTILRSCTEVHKVKQMAIRNINLLEKSYSRLRHMLKHVTVLVCDKSSIL